MAENSIAPQRRTVDLLLVGAAYTLRLFAADGTTQIDAGTVGGVTVTTGAVVAVPLDLRALGSEPANELVITGTGLLKIRLAHPLSPDFPVSEVNCANGRVIGQAVEQIVSIPNTITRISISWGGT
jgi:hypothetical protein